MIKSAVFFIWGILYWIVLPNILKINFNNNAPPLSGLEVLEFTFFMLTSMLITGGLIYFISSNWNKV
jgi:hypothetical protein